MMLVISAPEVCFGGFCGLRPGVPFPRLFRKLSDCCQHPPPVLGHRIDDHVTILK